MTTISTPTTEATTLAAWCAQSSEAYNIGAWQTALLLQSADFRQHVAREIASMELDDGHPAMIIWSKEL